MSTKVAVPCKGHKGAVDLRDSQYPERPGDGEVLHFSPAEWAEFLAAVKSGKFDDVLSRLDCLSLPRKPNS